MATEVILPKVDMDMATGKISRWFARDGEAVKKGEPLFEIETDKAAMEVDAPASGTLRDVTATEGVDIDVGTAVAWIYAEGEAYDRAASTAEVARPTNVGSDPNVGGEVAAADPSKVGEPTTGPVAERGSDTAGTNARAVRNEAGGERRAIRATPLARRLARERGFDLADLSGSGPAGRIQREDVERAVGKDSSTTPAAWAPRGDDGRSSQARATAGAAVPTRNSLFVSRLREGEGVPIVLIHGFGSESGSWRPLLAEVPAGRPVLGIDLPGHGGSVEDDSVGFDALVARVEDTLPAEGIVSCHLVGHSLGGAVAAAVAGGHATAARSLMLIAPAGFGPDIDTAFADEFAGATEEAPLRSWLRHLVADPAAISDGFVRATARGRADGRQSRAQTRLVRSLFSNGTQHFEVRSALAGLAIPVKIVAGAQDRVVPLGHFTGLPGRVALHVFAGTGHMPQIERRADVAGLLQELTR